MVKQAELADWLGVDASAISKNCKRWGVSVDGLSLKDAIRLFYRHHLEQSAGRVTFDDGEEFDLTLERAKTERMKQQALLLSIQEKSRQLIPADEFLRCLRPMMGAIRTHMLGIPDRVVHEYKALKGIDIDIYVIEDIVRDVMRACAETDVEKICNEVISGGGDVL